MPFMKCSTKKTGSIYAVYEMFNEENTGSIHAVYEMFNKENTGSIHGRRINRLQRNKSGDVSS